MRTAYEALLFALEVLFVELLKSDSYQPDFDKKIFKGECDGCPFEGTIIYVNTKDFRESMISYKSDDLTAPPQLLTMNDLVYITLGLVE